MKRFLRMLALGVFSLATGRADEPAVLLRTSQSSEGPIGISLEQEARVAVARGVRWLAARQKPEGYWSNPDDLALSALSLWALVQGGCADTSCIRRAAEYLSANQHADGSFLFSSNTARAKNDRTLFQTARCAIALAATREPAWAPVVRCARRYLAGAQPQATNAATACALLDAMRLTEQFDDPRTDDAAAPIFDPEAARRILLQNMDQPSPGRTADTDCACLLYAGVRRDDPRVQAALDGILRRAPMEGTAAATGQNLFEQLNVRAKALAAFGQDTLTTALGRRISWREETILLLLRLQKTDPGTGFGFWSQTDGDTDESALIQATAYGLLSLQLALRQQVE